MKVFDQEWVWRCYYPTSFYKEAKGQGMFAEVRAVYT